MENKTQNEEPLKLRILLVDDQLDDMKPVVDAFRFHGHNVITADNGKDALDILLKGGIDCMVLDLMMPEMAGDVVLSEILRYSELRELSFVILTAITDDDLVHRAYRKAAMQIRGGYRQFVKPTDPDKILQVFEHDVRDTIRRTGKKPSDFPPPKKTE